MQITHTPPVGNHFILALLFIITQTILAQVVIKDTVEITPKHSLHPNIIIPDPPPEPDPIVHEKFLILSSVSGYPAVDFGLIPGSDETVRLKLHYSFTLGDLHYGSGFNFYEAGWAIGPYYFSRFVEPNSSIHIEGTVDVFDFWGGMFSEGKFWFSINPGIIANNISINVGGDTATFYYDLYEEGIRYFTGFATLFVVRPDTLFNHFEVTFEKDTVAFTESSKIFVQAKDANDQDVELAADKLVKLTVTTNTDYGTFIDQSNDTLKTTPVKLEHIPYSDAKAGLIQFAAVKKNPVDPLLCKVKVELESDLTKAGEKEIPVVEQTLKIVMEGEHVVEPMNLKGSRKPQKPMAENKKEFTIQLTRNKTGVKNYAFTLTNFNTPGSGGHDHINTRPSDTQQKRRDNFGYYILKRTNDTIDVRPHTEQTQDDGKEKFEYVASVFGDRMMLRVETTEPNKKQFLWDTLSLAEKVDGLVEFLGSQNLITYTSPQAAVLHALANSNYGTPITNRVVRDVVDQYAFEYGMSPDVYLAVIDMSLPQGGKFDIKGIWIGAHQLHREGKSIDFSKFYRNHFGKDIEVGIYIDGTLRQKSKLIDEEKLDRKFAKLKFDRKEKSIGKIHYESAK